MHLKMVEWWRVWSVSAVLTFHTHLPVHLGERERCHPTERCCWIVYRVWIAFATGTRPAVTALFRSVIRTVPIETALCDPSTPDKSREKLRLGFWKLTNVDYTYNALKAIKYQRKLWVNKKCDVYLMKYSWTILVQLKREQTQFHKNVLEIVQNRFTGPFHSSGWTLSSHVNHIITCTKTCLTSAYLKPAWDYTRMCKKYKGLSRVNSCYSSDDIIQSVMFVSETCKDTGEKSHAHKNRWSHEGKTNMLRHTTQSSLRWN